jgi:hypothetical protein
MKTRKRNCSHRHHWIKTVGIPGEDSFVCRDCGIERPDYLFKKEESRTKLRGYNHEIIITDDIAWWSGNLEEAAVKIECKPDQKTRAQWRKDVFSKQANAKAQTRR